jgi:hypothetical protein
VTSPDRDATRRQEIDMLGLTMTTDPAEFSGSLQPGDVLLFEKLARLSGAIQAGDLRPVSHAAIVVDVAGGAPRMVDATLPGAGRLAVDETALADLLGQRRSDARGEVDRVRSVTARRPAGAGPRVAEQARGFIGRPDFPVLDLGLLAPYAFLRSSARRLSPGFSRLLQGFTDLARSIADEVVPADGPAVTCSELSYRCLTGAGVAVHVEAPLVVGGRFRTDWRLPSSTVQTAGLVPDEIPVGVLTQLGVLNDQIARAKAPAPVPVGPGPAPRRLGRGLETADGITPGDLLETPSLRTVSVLHRPMR